MQHVECRRNHFQHIVLCSGLTQQLSVSLFRLRPISLQIDRITLVERLLQSTFLSRRIVTNVQTSAKELEFNFNRRNVAVSSNCLGFNID
jgi:hypothetical protein